MHPRPLPRAERTLVLRTVADLPDGTRKDLSAGFMGISMWALENAEHAKKHESLIAAARYQGYAQAMREVCFLLGGPSVGESTFRELLDSDMPQQ